MLGDRVEKHDFSIRQHQHSRSIPCIGINALDPSHRMDWKEIMNWNSIDGMIPRRIPLAKSILQLGPLVIDSVGGLSWFHNLEVRGSRWHWDPDGFTGSRLSQRWTSDLGIKGSSYV